MACLPARDLPQCFAKRQHTRVNLGAPSFRLEPIRSPVPMSAPPSSPEPFYDEEPAWWRTVAWPQVLTLVAIGLAVLVPFLAVLVFASA